MGKKNTPGLGKVQKPQVVVSDAKFDSGLKAWFSKRFHFLRAHIILVVLTILIVLGVGGYFYYNQHILPSRAVNATVMEQNALNKGNKALALSYAKKALSSQPNNLGYILTVAYLSETQNPNEAKQYFALALTEMKKQNNPDVSDKSAETYWAAAGLAEQAGENSQAKHYYQEVIKAAKPSNAYEQSLAKQSQAALKRLQ